MKSLFVRPLQLLGLVFTVSLMAVLVVLALFTSSDFERIRSVRAHVNRTRLLQGIEIALEGLRIEPLPGAVVAGRIAEIRRNLELLPVEGGPIGRITAERVQTLEQLLSQTGTRSVVAVPQALELVDVMLKRETQIQGDLLDAVYADIRFERRVALMAFVGLPSLVFLVLWLLRERIFRPIGNLSALLSRLSEHDFAPVTLDRIDPLMRPLFENYNHMVTRLAQLEEATRTRTQSLEQEVRAAAGALLKQQQSLARAERLAAAGEVSATLAHELRNPIAGIHVTLANLLSESDDPAVQDRIRLVMAELQRITRLLNGLLQQSRHVPEPHRDVCVGALARELAALLAYQLPAHIRLVVDAPEDLHCRAPEDGLRQALLNLVLNAVEALQTSAGTVRVVIERHGTGIVLSVIDDGPGFPEAWLTGGVRPFATSRESGTGLGLAIARRFARDLGGELTIANIEPHGAAVTLSLPCRD